MRTRGFNKEKKCSDLGRDKYTGLLNHWLGLNANGHSTNGISVNGFLWRATLDTISFMPLAQADPFGGIILTDWYRPPETQDERFKINVYIFE